MTPIEKFVLARQLAEAVTREEQEGFELRCNEATLAELGRILMAADTNWEVEIAARVARERLAREVRR